MNAAQNTLSLLNTLDIALKEYKTYIYTKYLNQEEIPLFMREFYSESPSWFMNNVVPDMKNTIHWSSLHDSRKLEILDHDLEEYFNH